MNNFGNVGFARNSAEMALARRKPITARHGIYR
jgi:hypothetical protein